MPGQSIHLPFSPDDQATHRCNEGIDEEQGINNMTDANIYDEGEESEEDDADNIASNFISIALDNGNCGITTMGDNVYN